MTATTKLAAAEELEHWISSGLFASRVDEYLDMTYRAQSDTASNFYGKLLAAEGLEAAETKLEAVVSRSRLREIAGSLEPLAQAALKLAKVESNYVPVYLQPAALVRLRTLTTDSHRSERAKLLTIFNPQFWGHNRKSPDDSRIFFPTGELGLKAITLYADPAFPNHTSISLVLPARHKDADADDFVTLSFTRRGSTRLGRTYKQPNENSLLDFCLGIVEPEQAFGLTASSGGNPNEVLGFPGALDYIVDRLDRLASYLTEVAEALSADATH